MNKEQIETRIKTLEEEKSKCLHAICAFDGAIQDCQHWLSKVEETKQNDS